MILRDLFICANLVNEKRHLILNHISLMTSEVKYLFICQLIVWISSSLIYLFTFFTIFFFPFSLFIFLLTYKMFFILDINPVSFMHWKYFMSISFLKEFGALSFRVFFMQKRFAKLSFRVFCSLIPVPKSLIIHPKSTFPWFPGSSMKHNRVQ